MYVLGACLEVLSPRDVSFRAPPIYAIANEISIFIAYAQMPLINAFVGVFTAGIFETFMLQIIINRLTDSRKSHKVDRITMVPMLLRSKLRVLDVQAIYCQMNLKEYVDWLKQLRRKEGFITHAIDMFMRKNVLCICHLQNLKPACSASSQHAQPLLICDLHNLKQAWSDSGQHAHTLLICDLQNLKPA